MKAGVQRAEPGGTTLLETSFYSESQHVINMVNASRLVMTHLKPDYSCTLLAYISVFPLDIGVHVRAPGNRLTGY